MKRGTPQHPKVSDLASRLKVELYAAVGLLEMLWHFAGDYAPQGDIGRHTDESIAKALRWKKSPAILVQALTDSRWIDLSESHRLIVHDWRDHCDDSVHMKLARARQTFCDGEPPKLKRLPTREREDAERFYDTRSVLGVRTESAQDALYGIGKAKAKAKAKAEESPERNQNGPSSEFSQVEPWDRWQGMFVGGIEEDAWREFIAAASTPDRLAALMANTPRWMQTKRYAEGFTGAAKFLKSGVWLKPPPAQMLSGQKSAAQRQLEDLHVEEEPE